MGAVFTILLSVCPVSVSQSVKCKTVSFLKSLGGGGVSGLQSTFNLSRSYDQLQVGFNGVYRHMEV